jgi:uncharacterized membrane protein YccC
VDKIFDETFLQSARELLTLLLDRFGAGGTIALVVVVLLALFAWRRYSDWRTDRMIDRALAEKERTIQRLANQERTWRRFFLTQHLNIPAEEVDRLLLLEGNYQDAKEARTAVEPRPKS